MTTPAQKITERLGGRWHNGFGTARCPAHKDARPSLSIHDGTTQTIFKCFVGCTSLSIVRALARRHLLERHGATAATTTSKPRDDAGRKNMALRLWHASNPALGTIAETYLRNRGITSPVPPSIRHHSAAKHSPTDLYLDAMIAAVQAPDRSVVAIHRTFLSATGRKAPVSDPKMGLGCYGAGAVRLAAAGEVLGIAEGIETGLSAMQLFGVPTWCSLGAERLGKIELPLIVRRVIIFGDRGAEAQVERARVAYQQDGCVVDLRYPDPPAKDFNDVVQIGQLAYLARDDAV